MHEINKIDLKSTIKISTFFGLVWGIIVSIVMWITSIIIAPKITEEMIAQFPQLITIASFGWKTALGLLIQYVIVGFLLGLLIVIAYNLISKKIGGIKIDLVDKHQKKK
jgi:uncharacterized membrane protein YagU involved in acid resistance